jgi:exodeoxyribonuclease V alpha subunit
MRAVVRLTEAVRQAAQSGIITTAHRSNEGLMPDPPARRAESDFYLIDQAELEAIAATAVGLAQTRIPARSGLDPSATSECSAPRIGGPWAPPS